MKKTLLIIGVLLIIFYFVSSSSNPLVGEWADDQDTVIFKSNGEFTSSTYFMTGTYTVDGNQLTMNVPMIGKEVYKFSIQNKTLIMSGELYGSKTRYVFNKK